MSRYGTLYERLKAAYAKQALDGNPSSIYGNYLMEIMSMHPYGSYCWKPSQTVSKEALKGKGEAILSRVLKSEYDIGQENGSGNLIA